MTGSYGQDCSAKEGNSGLSFIASLWSVPLLYKLAVSG